MAFFQFKIRKANEISLIGGEVSFQIKALYKKNRELLVNVRVAS